MEKNCVNCIWHDSCQKGNIMLELCKDYYDSTEEDIYEDNKQKYYEDYIEYIKEYNDER